MSPWLSCGNADSDGKGPGCGPSVLISNLLPGDAGDLCPPPRWHQQAPSVSGQTANGLGTGEVFVLFF